MAIEILVIFFSIIAFSVIFSLTIYYSKYKHDEKTIIKEIEKDGGKLIYLKSRTGLVKREWDVVYNNKDGIKKTGICIVQPGWGDSVYWKKGSFLENDLN